MNPQTQTHDELLIFRQDRKKVLGIILIGVGFVVLSVSFIIHPNYWQSTIGSANQIKMAGWLLTPLFSLFLIGIIVRLIRPTTVKLGRDGIVISSFWRTYARPWVAVGGFRLFDLHGSRSVVFNDTVSADSHLSMINRGLSGATSSLPTALNVSPEQLLEAVRTAKARWHIDVGTGEETE